MRPHRWQPTRLLCPWDSPGKNTGVVCHFLLQCMKVKSESEVAQLCSTLSDWTGRLQPTRLLRPWDFPGKSTGVGCHCLLWVTVISGWERAGSVLSGEKQCMPSLLAEEADSRHQRASQRSHSCESLKGHAPGSSLLMQVTRNRIKP